MAEARAWVLEGPGKALAKVYVETVAPTQRECWAKAYPIVCRKLGDEWVRQTWKQWDASIRSAKDHRYRMVRCTLTT